MRDRFDVLELAVMTVMITAGLVASRLRQRGAPVRQGILVARIAKLRSIRRARTLDGVRQHHHRVIAQRGHRIGHSPLYLPCRPRRTSRQRPVLAEKCVE